MNRVLTLATVGLAFAAFAGTGCKKNKDDNSSASQSVPSVATPAFVRVVHGADAGSVDVAVNGLGVASGLAKNAFVRERVPFPAGASTVTISSNGSQVASANINVNAGSNYTFVVLGNSASGFEGVLINDQLAGANGKNRFVHGVPGVGAVDVHTDAGVALVSGLNYRQASNFVAPPAGFTRAAVKSGGATIAVDAVPTNAARAVTTVIVKQGAGAHFINVVDRTN